MGAKMDGRKVCKGLCKEMVQILMIGKVGIRKTEGKGGRTGLQRGRSNLWIKGKEVNKEKNQT